MLGLYAVIKPALVIISVGGVGIGIASDVSSCRPPVPVAPVPPLDAGPPPPLL